VCRVAPSRVEVEEVQLPPPTLSNRQRINVTQFIVLDIYMINIYTCIYIERLLFYCYDCFFAFLIYINVIKFGINFINGIIKCLNQIGRADPPTLIRFSLSLPLHDCASSIFLSFYLSQCYVYVFKCECT